MKITLEEVRRISLLAHLEFGAEDLERLRGQLDQILGYIGKLDELETEGVAPFGGDPVPGALLRPDEPLPTLSVEEALANAPEKGSGHFKVPRVLG